jgi:hypothetical protein
MSDTAQLSGAKELQSFAANPFIIYDYASYTEVDIWLADRFQDHFLHYLLITKINTYRVIRMQ